MQYFEFGEDWVKFHDDEKTYIVTIKEVKHPEETILNGVESIEKKKSTKDTSKVKKKTWEAILKERK